MMITLTIILAEITIVLLGVVTVIGVKALRRRRRDQDAVNTLVISIKANQPARVEKLKGILIDSSNLSEEDASEKANELIKKQNKFCQEAVDLYLTRNNEILSKLDNRLEDLLGQYRGFLKITTQEDVRVDPEAMEQFSKDIAALSKEIEELRTENSTLSTQLKAAEDELDQLGREYVSAFNKPKQDKPKEEKSEESQEAHEAQDAENDRPESNADENIVVEGAEPVSEDAAEEDKVKAVDETQDEMQDQEEASIEPPAEEVPPLNENESPPSPATADAKTDTKQESKVSFMEDSDDQNLFADLGLDELIGEQPGQRAVAGKSAEKK